MKVTLFVVLMVVAVVHCKTLARKEEMRRVDKMQKRAEASPKQQRDLQTRSWNVYVIKLIMKYLKGLNGYDTQLLYEFQSDYYIDPSYFYSDYHDTTPFSIPTYPTLYKDFTYQNLPTSFIPPSWIQTSNGKIIPPSPTSFGGPCDPATDFWCYPTFPCSPSDLNCGPTICDPATEVDCIPTTPPCDPITDPGCGPTIPCIPFVDPGCGPTIPCNPATDPGCGPTTPCNPITDPGCGPTIPCIPFLDPGCSFPSS